MNSPIPASAATAASAAAARPSVLQLAIKEKAALYAAYIPLFKDGGIFVPTPKDYALGDDVYLLLTLPQDPQRYPIAGKVGWVTPAGAGGNRTPGIGVRFPKDPKTDELRYKMSRFWARRCRRIAPRKPSDSPWWPLVVVLSTLSNRVFCFYGQQQKRLSRDNSGSFLT